MDQDLSIELFKSLESLRAESSQIWAEAEVVVNDNYVAPMTKLKSLNAASRKVNKLNQRARALVLKAHRLGTEQ